MTAKSQDHTNLSGTFDFSILLLIPVFAILIFLSACNKEKILYSKSEEIGKQGWAYNDPITFSFSAMDTTQVYDLNLEITHDREYAWQNLYVRIQTSFPGDSIKTDVLSLEFSDGIGGWAGSCSGKTCDLTIPLQKHVKFPLPGEYALKFEQYMRQEIVPGILGLQLTVLQAENEKAGK